MTAYQGKTKKNVAILSTYHQNITMADNAEKTPESVKMIQNLMLILWIKWQGNTRLELPPEDGLFICSKTQWSWRI